VLRRLSLITALGVAMAVGLVATPASAAPSLAEICATTQSDLALIDQEAFDAAGLSIVDETFDTFDDFVLSKSGVDPSTGEILTTSYAEFDPDDPSIIKQIRCKARSGESLDQGAWPPGSTNNSPGFERPEFFGFGDAATGVSGGKGTCRTVNDRLVDEVWSSLSPEQQAASAFSPEDGTLVTVPDQEEFIGPLWTSAFEPVEIVDGVLRVRAKSLYAPTTDQSGIGPRFLGAYYCTLVGPDFLAALIAENSAPIPTTTPTATPTPTPTATPTDDGTPIPAPPVPPIEGDTLPPSSPEEGTAASTLPATGGAATGPLVLGLLALMVGIALLGKAHVGRLLAAGPGRHRHGAHR
jgi:hypothetical protein